MPGLDRVFVALTVAGIVAGCLITAGLPWIFGELFKLFIGQQF